MLALACLAADNQDYLVPYSKRLFRAIFVDSLVVDDAVLRMIALDHGLDIEQFIRDHGAPETAARHQAILQEAHRRGAFGVPTFFLGERMFWGNDHLAILRHFIRKQSAGGGGASLQGPGTKDAPA